MHLGQCAIHGKSVEQYAVVSACCACHTPVECSSPPALDDPDCAYGCLHTPHAPQKILFQKTLRHRHHLFGPPWALALPDSRSEVSSYRDFFSTRHATTHDRHSCCFTCAQVADASPASKRARQGAAGDGASVAEAGGYAKAGIQPEHAQSALRPPGEGRRYINIPNALSSVPPPVGLW